MGGWLSRKTKELDTVVLLEELTKNIEELEELRKSNVENQKRTVALFIFYSTILYFTIAIVRYFYFVQDDWIWKVAYSAPLLVFPFLIYLIKRALRWYFVKRISKNESQLENLKEQKKKILDEVMEKETYKKAKEILERFSPESSRLDLEEEAPQERISKGEMSVRKRNISNVSLDATAHSSFMDTTVNQGQRPQQPIPVRPMPVRPILKQNRTYVDKLVDFLLGDGPQHRYALICSECRSHNGMALQEEFEYISFRCVYCSTFNASRKQKPAAPRLISGRAEVVQELRRPESDTDVTKLEGTAASSTPDSCHAE